MLQRPSHLGLRHLALHAREFDAMKSFYVDLLGFQVEWEPDADNVYLSSGSDNLALHRSQSPRETPHGDTALDHLGMIVRAADDVDQWSRFLEESGVPLDTKPRTHRDGARSFYFRDPDGNRVQIIYHGPISDRA